MVRPPRQRTTPNDELVVLDKSRRRCALCFHINGDQTEKHGQIAHLDENPSNSIEENLVFLCLPHHSVYDSTTSQHKNYTVAEVKKAREALYRTVEDGRHLGAHVTGPNFVEHDRRILADIEDKLNGDPMQFCRTQDFGNGFLFDKLYSLFELTEREDGAEFEFLDEEREAQRGSFMKAAHAFVRSVAENTSSIDHNINFARISRDWSRDDQRHAADEINGLARIFNDEYNTLIRLARRKLA